MRSFFKSLFGKSAPKLAEGAPMPACVPHGQRIYAIGDVHGRLDLLVALVEAIEADDAASGAADTTFILLGDLVDRGPNSAGVVDFARQWQQRSKVHILAGNHEEMFLRGFESVDILRHFLRHGGKDTLYSYGVARKDYTISTVEEVQELMRATISVEERAFIAGFEDWVAIGDYVFVHAGIDPGVPMEDQKPADLRWIREPFLSWEEPHGAVVVHGHTITDSPVDNGIRIGVDTGAYASGRLTALVLEGAGRRYIETEQNGDENGNGDIAIRYSPADSSPHIRAAFK